MSPRGSRVYFPIISRRERSVLFLMAEGYKNQEIADELTISEKTVKGTQVNLMRRWNAPDVSSIIDHALEEGWISVYEVLESRFSRRSAQPS
ncbi:MAG TPA: LuxR C-terminal-related transcriptional regulator [Thermodesulfobacteriota bacterium]|nr:LuxR C-terminal-related transcriptional regulator [Thermodesulfobacteriota bacterium]